MSIKKDSIRSTLKSNAQITDKGIQDPDSKQKLVVVGGTPYGNYKKIFLASTIALLSAAVNFGLATDWTDSYVHIVWPLGFTTVIAVATVLTSKIE